MPEGEFPCQPCAPGIARPQIEGKRVAVGAGGEALIRLGLVGAFIADPGGEPVVDLIGGGKGADGQVARAAVIRQRAKAQGEPVRRGLALCRYGQAGGGRGQDRRKL